MKFEKKLVAGTQDMYFIAYVRDDGTERICIETGFAEAFPDRRATEIVEALNKALAGGQVDPEQPINLAKLMTADDQVVKDSEEKPVVVEVPTAKKSSAAKKTTKQSK